VTRPDVFIDTSGWFRYVVRGRSEAEDRASGEVRGAIERCVRDRVPLWTTNLVVAETHQLLLSRTNRATARLFLGTLPLPRLEVVTSTPDLESRALREWIDRFDGEDFSLCDAVSFAVMAEQGIRSALALDGHFQVAGFAVLPARKAAR